MIPSNDFAHNRFPLPGRSSWPRASGPRSSPSPASRWACSPPWGAASWASPPAKCLPSTSMTWILSQTLQCVNSFLSRENKALAMGHDNNASAQTKKKKTLKRIYEWQRFEANCQIVKDLDDEQIIRISEIHKEMSKQSTPVRPRSGKRKES